jgi:hypothetical protein
MCRQIVGDAQAPIQALSRGLLVVSGIYGGVQAVLEQRYR